MVTCLWRLISRVGIRWNSGVFWMQDTLSQGILPKSDNSPEFDMLWGLWATHIGAGFWQNASTCIIYPRIEGKIFRKPWYLSIPWFLVNYVLLPTIASTYKPNSGRDWAIRWRHSPLSFQLIPRRTDTWKRCSNLAMFGELGVIMSSSLHQMKPCLGLIATVHCDRMISHVFVHLFSLFLEKRFTRAGESARIQELHWA
jgi:hypothetical protein